MISIFPFPNAFMVSGLCNMQLYQFSFLYIQTLNNDCLHTEDVHRLFCAHLMVFYYTFRNVDIVTSTPPLGCLHWVDQYYKWQFRSRAEFGLVRDLYLAATSTK